jgi:Phospholipase_D-nuclease N-terminal/Short C-terminal domain
MVLADFWESFFLFLIFLPLALLWAFALIDIFRRDDIGGVGKALWIACVILVPFFGTLIYMIVRPPGATKEERVAIEAATREYASPNDRAGQLSTLADLHDRGKLTDAEFDAEKARVLGGIQGRAVTP